MSWSTSDRRSRLPSDWKQRVAATKDRAGGRCEGISLDGEPRWHVDTCDGVGTDCDHDTRGDDHSLANLTWLSADCHKRKTQQEAWAGLMALNAKRKHPSARSLPPGLR